jgi:hypothetical protein
MLKRMIRRLLRLTHLSRTPDTPQVNAVERERQRMRLRKHLRLLEHQRACRMSGRTAAK